MPELPEVETVRAGLQRLLPGRVVVNVRYNWPKSFPNSQSDTDVALVGAAVIGVRRRAKVLLIDLSTSYTLVVHLKMTGQLVFRGEEAFGAGHPNDSLIGVLPDRSTRVILAFNDGSTLYFNDQRKFGWMRLVPTSEIGFIDFFKKVGPEPLGPELSADILFQRLQRHKNTSIKAAILDQTVIAGIGNIYADESLWGAKIHPAAMVKSLSKSKVAVLYDEIVYVLRLAIEKGGSTDKNYVDAEGKRGSYLQFARVFRREGLECPRCGSMIEKTRVAGRGTHYCPICQKIPALPHIRKRK